MRLLGVIFSFFVLTLFSMTHSACEVSKSKNGQFQLVNEPPFKIIESYSQDWLAGLEDGNSGTNLFITIDKITEDIDMQELYFRGMMVKPKISPNKRNQYIGYFINEVNNDIIMDGDHVKESKNIPPQKIPFQLKDQEAIIGFLLNGVIKYCKLTNIETKPPIAYPSNNRDKDH